MRLPLCQMFLVVSKGMGDAPEGLFVSL